MRILLVEDDMVLGDGICEGLKQANYAVDWIKDGVQVMPALEMESFDAVVLDIGLPSIDGITVLSRLRSKGFRIPVILLTARDSIDDRVDGLDAGADDYLTKPFAINELLARLRALLRRSSGRAEPVIRHQDIELNPATYEVYQNGKQIELSRREFATLSYLLQSVGRVITREKLTESLYGWSEEVDSNAIEVHIHHLRKKFGSNLIKTVRGVGYMINKEKKAP
ncbi:response regulator transcription factor [Thiotrichales bacterium 19S9-12]|nr:response regulator transcription factor [Thiotrichales bacterium 19S9-11]MCF6811170.1 response regulator transcription factor [Thiotrichales bacterium 19S9-12]